MQLEHYIKRFFQKSEIFSIPNFGTFSPVKKAAKFNVTRDTIIPPRIFWNFYGLKEIDSALFIEAVAQGEGLNISKAKLNINAQVDKWKAELTEKLALKIDGLGSFVKNPNGNQITFTYSDKVENIQVEFYGLKPLKLKEKVKKVELPSPSLEFKERQKNKEIFFPKEIKPEYEEVVLESDDYKVDDEIYYEEESGLSQKTLWIIIIVFFIIITPFVLHIFEIVDFRVLLEIFSLKLLESSEKI